MDQDTFLLLFLVVSCGATLVRVARNPSRQYMTGWLIVPAAILAITGISYFVIRDKAVTIGSVAWLIFLLIPSLGTRWLARLTYQQRFTQAVSLARILAILHPFDGWLIQPQVFRALAFMQQGKVPEALEIYRLYADNRSAVGITARLHLYRGQRRWPELVAWLDQNPELRTNPTALGIYIRALGEIGDVNRMITTFSQSQVLLGRMMMLSSTALFVFAFSGRREALAQLFSGTQHLYPTGLQKYWLGIADFTAGNDEQARQEMTEASLSADFSTRTAAIERLKNPPQVAGTMLSAHSQQSIRQIEQAVELDAKFGRTMFARRAVPFATYALILINVIVFGLETVSGGNDNLETLFKLGGLVPSLVIDQGDWWRLLTAMFLHYGLFHIGANMLALFALGPFVERALGLRRYLLTYFTAGLGSMLVIVVLTQSKTLEQGITVGASGAIMGLVGAMGAIMVRGWLVDRAAVARQRLVQVLVIVAMQAAIDIAVPASSFTGHLSGAIIGFLIASRLEHYLQRPLPTVTRSHS